jgi:hypothetical protein
MGRIYLALAILLGAIQAGEKAKAPPELSPEFKKVAVLAYEAIQRLDERQSDAREIDADRAVHEAERAAKSADDLEAQFALGYLLHEYPSKDRTFVEHDVVISAIRAEKLEKADEELRRRFARPKELARARATAACGMVIETWLSTYGKWSWEERGIEPRTCRRMVVAWVDASTPK